MRFFEVVLSGTALVSAAFAVEFNTFPEKVTAGQTVTLTYSPKDVATTILLRKGASKDLKTLETLTTTSTGGSFEWTVPEDLVNAEDYAFEIDQGEDSNYSGLFTLEGGLAPVASASSSAAYSTAESSSASATATLPVSSPAYSTGVSTMMTTTAVGSASASIMPSHGLNSTISTGSPSATVSEGSPSSTGAPPPVENTGAASSFGINAAALFGAIGAFAYLA